MGESGGGRGRQRGIRGSRSRPGRLIDSTLAGKVRRNRRPLPNPASEPVTALGRHVTRRVQALKAALDFTGRATVTFGRACTSWRRLRPASIARHIYETGITAIPIVSLISFSSR